MVSPLIFGLALKILERTAAAEEAVIEVFLHVRHRGCDLDASREAPLAWLTRLTRSVSLERLRGEEIAPAEPTASEEWVTRSGTSNAGARMWISEQATSARRALACLAPELRGPVELAFFNGLTAVQISARLQIPVPAVKSRIREGITAFRDNLRSGPGPGEQNG